MYLEVKDLNFDSKKMQNDYTITLFREKIRVIHMSGIFNEESFGELAEPHSHSHCEIFFHMKGTISVLVDGTPYKINPGDLRLYASGEIHSGRIESAQEMEWYQISIPVAAFYELPCGELLSQCFLKRKAGTKNRVHPQNFDDMLAILHQAEVLSQDHPTTPPLRYALLLQLLCYTSAAYASLRDDEKGNLILPEPLANALATVSADFCEIRSAKEIALRTHVSVSYLGYLFRTYLGCTPYAYLVGKKIEEAKKDYRRAHP